MTVIICRKRTASVGSGGRETLSRRIMRDGPVDDSNRWRDASRPVPFINGGRNSSTRAVEIAVSSEDVSVPLRESIPAFERLPAVIGRSPYVNEESVLMAVASTTLSREFLRRDVFVTRQSVAVSGVAETLADHSVTPRSIPTGETASGTRGSSTPNTSPRSASPADLDSRLGRYYGLEPVPRLRTASRRRLTAERARVDATRSRRIDQSAG